MPAIAMPGEENAWLFWLVPALERGTDQKSDARAPRTAVPRWSVGTKKNGAAYDTMENPMPSAHRIFDTQMVRVRKSTPQHQRPKSNALSPAMPQFSFGTS